MRVAIPMAQGRLSPHFGHCEAFGLFDVDPETGSITGERVLPAPPHQPGLLPRWLAEQGADAVVAGGMGRRARALFEQNGIRVVVGAPADDPRAIAEAFVRGTLRTGENICDH